MGYVVTAPLIQARKEDGSFVHIYEGGFLPDDQDPEQLEQLIAGELVEEAEDPPAPEEEPSAPAEKPAPRKAAAKKAATSRRRSK